MNKSSYNTLPQSPGIYIFKNKPGQILYIGKSKSLRKRVQTYFQNTSKLPPDKQLMIKQVVKIDHIVTDSELEALLLETTLIKKHRPKYNILLKDDKNYQYIKIDNSWDFPKIYTVRHIEDHKANAQYFGPFTDGTAVKQTLELMRKLFRYRTCNREIPYDLSKLYSRSCLNHHIKLCLGPCIGAVNREDYEQTIHNCVQFLQGKQTEIASELKLEMAKASENKNFERAAILRDQLSDIKKLTAKQKVIAPNQDNFDVVSFYRKDKISVFNVFLVRDGKLIGKENFSVSLPDHPGDEEVMGTFLERYYSTTKSLPKKVVLQAEPLNTDLVQRLLKIKSRAISVPERGKLKKLVELGVTNAREYWHKRQEQAKPTENVLEQLQQVLDLPHLPHRIEAYDISNLQGTNPTGSMAVFENSQPKKTDYRRFKVKIKQTPDDVSMLREIIARRLQHPDWARPDLMLIDGGKPQLHAAEQVLLEKKVKIPLASIAKREEEVFVIGKTKPIKLAKSNPALQLLQRLRDEAHRFAIGHHTRLRQKQSVKSTLDQIPGIGPKTKKKLLIKYGSIANIRSAKSDDLARLVGQAKAKIIKESL
ncbi:excinuclease ABC subunit UvrC [Patescibacteria group bacterium]